MSKIGLIPQQDGEWLNDATNQKRILRVGMRKSTQTAPLPQAGTGGLGDRDQGDAFTSDTKILTFPENG